MSRYKIKTGFNQPLLDLVNIFPRCRSAGILAIRRDFAADGSAVEQGAYLELVVDLMQSGVSYATFLTQFGLSDTVMKSNVTVYAKNHVFAWVRKNGVAIRPEVGADVTWERFFPRDIKILIKQLEDPT